MDLLNRQLDPPCRKRINIRFAVYSLAAAALPCVIACISGASKSSENDPMRITMVTFTTTPAFAFPDNVKVVPK
jgi:hypothetical protein